MQEIICPICYKVHTSMPYKCECGYDEVRLTPKDYSDYNELAFTRYKFSKLIFNKKIEWKQSKYDLHDYLDDDGKNRVIIQEIFDDRAVAYVDLQMEDKIVEVDAGALAFKWNIRSLIINADRLNHLMLDESSVRMIFIGDRVKEISSLISVSLKYLEVDKNNPYFTSQNNVLFNKDMTKLILYCNLKPDEEYTIPESVKVVCSRAFIGLSHEDAALKVIHCSKNVKFEDPNHTPSPYEHIKIIRDK